MPDHILTTASVRDTVDAGKRERCENCRWRSAYPFVNPDRGTAEFRDIMFACQRRAPVATGGLHTPSITIWPMVTLSHFCGEFTPTKQEEPR